MRIKGLKLKANVNVNVETAGGDGAESLRKAVLLMTTSLARQRVTRNHQQKDLMFFFLPGAST